MLERTIIGSGARLIKVDLQGDFGLAADLDCAPCRGRREGSRHEGHGDLPALFIVHTRGSWTIRPTQ